MSTTKTAKKKATKKTASPRTAKGKPFTCNVGSNAIIPPAIERLKITAEFLKKHDACSEGLTAFTKKFPKGCTYRQLREWLVTIKREDWETWIKAKVGGDIATAGYKGTATAGYKGTASVGDAGVLSIRYYDYKAMRYKVVIGYVGEGGLLPRKKYRLNAQAQFEEVPEPVVAPTATEEQKAE